MIDRAIQILNDANDDILDCIKAFPTDIIKELLMI